MSLFFNAHRVNSWIQGSNKRFYPLFGLTQLGNFTVDNPVMLSLEMFVWAFRPRITFMQCYSPFSKALISDDIFEHNPYLLTFLLGKDFIMNNKSFESIQRVIEYDKPYLLLDECCTKSIPEMHARLEIVVCNDDA